MDQKGITDRAQPVIIPVDTATDNLFIILQMLSSVGRRLSQMKIFKSITLSFAELICSHVIV